MLRVFKNFLKEEDGLGTVEIVIIIAVLVAVALLFRKVIIDFVSGLLGNIFNSANDQKPGSVDITNPVKPTPPG